MALFRQLLKSGALTLLACYGWLRIRLVRSPTLLILTYHRVLPANASERETEQPGMITSPESLQKHISLICKLGAEPIHLDDWLERNELKKKLPRLAVAFTFDDGWQDNFQYAYPELKAQNTPATIFLVTQMVDTDKTFWPETVLQLLTTAPIRTEEPEYQWLIPFLPKGEAGSLPLALKDADEVIGRLKSLSDQTIYAHLSRIQTEPDQAPKINKNRVILNREEIAEMGASGLIKFGAHTQNHYRLNRLTNASLFHSEIVDCLKDLETYGPAAIPVFCYPNGDITAKGEALVKQTYNAACTTKTGWNRPATRSPHDLHRFNLHDGNSFSQLRFLATLGRGIL